MQMSYAFYHNDVFIRGYEPGDVLTLMSAGTIDVEVDNVKEALEKLFDRYNIDFPVGYEGRSMSVGDVIVIGETAWSCENSGWKSVDISSAKVVVSGYHDSSV